MTTEYRRAVERHWGTPVPGGLKHHYRSYAARIYGCDCQDCLPSGIRKYAVHEDRALTRLERERRSRANLKGKPVPPHVKHGIYAYNVYRCRCDICTGARAAQVARQRNAWRAKARGRWTQDGARTMVCWPPANAGADWKCPICGGA